MQRTTLIKLFTLVLISGLGATLQAPASADARQIERATAVPYGDLDLGATAGVERLYKRLRHAAKDVCDARYRPGTLVIDPRFRTCMADALDRAVAEVDDRALTAYHTARTEAGGRSGNRVAAVVERN